jgi:hypothetical protein
VAVAVAAMGCVGGPRYGANVSGPPDFLTGEFVDDYGIRYSIAPEKWVHLPNAGYHIVEWQIDEQFLIARNAASNPSDGNLWTRIDWVELTNGGEYEWAFCYATYNAASAQAAREAPPSQRDTPRVGCGGYPFSRMRRVGS